MLQFSLKNRTIRLAIGLKAWSVTLRHNNKNSFSMDLIQVVEEDVDPWDKEDTVFAKALWSIRG